jgi:hypothetical protein
VAGELRYIYANGWCYVYVWNGLGWVFLYATPL